MNPTSFQFANWLQTDQSFCKLQTGCKLNSLKNIELHQFAVCNPSVCKISCKLKKTYLSQLITSQFQIAKPPSPLRGERTTSRPLPRSVEGLPGIDDRDRRPGTAILALDLGTTTGWALLERDGSTTSGSETFKPQRFEGGGMRYLRFKRWLTEIKQSTDGLDAVYFEEVRRHAGVDAAHAYGGFLATLTAWCEHHNIPYQGVPVGTIKKHATGKGNASKDMVIAAVRAWGFAPNDDNEADALALLMWAIATQEVPA